MAIAYPAARGDLERATDLFRLFREQPTSEKARSPREGVRTALSPNERLQQIFHPFSSYVIVPLFALANAGIVISGGFLAPRLRLADHAGDPGRLRGRQADRDHRRAWLVTRLSRDGCGHRSAGPPVLGGGTIAGIGFTVSLLIASLAFHGATGGGQAGVLTAALPPLLTWVVFQVTSLLPDGTAARTARHLHSIIDLAVPVDPDRDHVRGPKDAPVTLVEYGDFECPYCGRAEPRPRAAADFGDLRYVWRHLPLNDVHPHAQLAAEARGGRRRPGRVLGDARPAALPPGRAHRARPRRPRAGLGWTSSGSARPAQAKGAGGRRGR